MPRMTRAAMRILEDEAALAADTPLPSTPMVERSPLGEIAANQKVEQIIELGTDVVKSSEKKGANIGKPRTGRKAKKSKKAVPGTETDDYPVHHQEILDDEHESATSSAVEDACEELLRPGPTKAMSQTAMHDKRPTTPPSKAVLAARRHLSPQKPQTPRFNPEVHKVRTPTSASDKSEDSFIGTITARTPARITIVVDALQLSRDEASSPSMSPIVKTTETSISRIEDSVEAIDALEDALERVTEELMPQSPAKVPEAVAKEMSRSASPRKQTSKDNRLLKSNASSPSVKPLARPSIASKKAVNTPCTTKSATLATSTTRPSPTKSSETSTSPSTDTKIASNKASKPLAKPRVSSITKAPFVPKRSTKAPTTSSFTLPGEAIAQKLKAQREERQKKESEVPAPAVKEAAVKTKKPVFKARPVRISAVTPVVRETAASRARLSMATGKPIEKSTPPTTKRPIGQPVTKARVSSVGSTLTSLDGQIISKSKSVVSPVQDIAPGRRKQQRPSTTTAVQSRKPLPTPRANTSAPRSSPASTTSAVVIPASTQRSVSAEQAAVLKQKGKANFRRVQIEKEAADKEKKAKEDAVKKAKAEAAERGRLASREWAERMKMKSKRVTSTTVVVDGSP